MAGTRVLLTIDTELIWRPGVDQSPWQDSVERSYHAAGVGIEYQLGILSRHGLKACFFVDPMPALVFGIDPIKRMLEPILDAGQEVQLHLHPIWTNIRNRHGERQPHLASYDPSVQHELISRARDLLVEAGAPDPIAFRAGNFSASDATLGVLAQLGFRLDSSHNGDHHPWPSTIDLPRDHITPVMREGIIELPITVIADGKGSRHLQICAVSLNELKAATRLARKQGLPIVNIVSHSFELANRARTAPNKVHVRRFEGFCAWLARNRDTLPTCYFRDLEGLPTDIPSTVLATGGGRRIGRLIEQLWSNHIGERGP